MVALHCFAPVFRPDARLLILGSLPGAASLAAGHYYAHPRNQFWRLLETVIGQEFQALGYEERLQRLIEHRIALWDTVAAGHRRGSLDADIRLAEVSDIKTLATRLPELRGIAFNGGTAARIGRRQIGDPGKLTLIDLPSSSPAFTLRFPAKAERWGALRSVLA